jgi:hypothetical protein
VATSHNFGAKRIAFTSLLLSWRAVLFFLFYLLSVSNAVSCSFLGMVVVADSPLLSTLVAQNAQQK